MTELGIGVIGMGWMGQVHARSYSLARQRFPDGGVSARLVICSDNVAQRAETARDTARLRARHDALAGCHRSIPMCRS